MQSDEKKIIKRKLNDYQRGALTASVSKSTRIIKMPTLSFLEKDKNLLKEKY